MIKTNKDQLLEMMKDYGDASSEYQAADYWSRYTKDILDYVLRDGLGSFRATTAPRLLTKFVAGNYFCLTPTIATINPSPSLMVRLISRMFGLFSRIVPEFKEFNTYRKNILISEEFKELRNSK